MTDIFTEVEADLRREKVESLWRRYGGYVLLAAILVVVGVAGWRGYEAWATARDQEAGARYLALMAEADTVRTVGSAEALLAFASDAPGDVGVLARFRAATAFDAAGETTRAEETLRALADDTAVPAMYRDVARIRLAQVLLDAGSTAQAREVVAPMADDAGNPFSRSAQEIAGIAAYVDGDLEAARKRFAALSDDVGTTSQMRQRATAMVGLIAQVAPAPETPAPEAPAAAPAPAPAAAPATTAPDSPATPTAAPSTPAAGAATTTEADTDAAVAETAPAQETN